MAQENRRLEVMVRTFVLDAVNYPADKPESCKIINQYDSSDRQWLAKHAWWAMHNGREVRTQPN